MRPSQSLQWTVGKSLAELSGGSLTRRKGFSEGVV